MTKLSLIVIALLSASACVSVHAHRHEPETRPQPGSNLMLRAPITISSELEVILSDVVIPSGATVPRHYHPGEEYIYVIEGSAIHVEEGKDDLILRAGDAYVIPPETEHAPRGGPNGARAIVFRVHKQGLPERVNIGMTGPIPDFHDLGLRVDASKLAELKSNVMSRSDAHCHAMASRAEMCHLANGREVYAFTEEGAPAHPSILFRGFVNEGGDAPQLIERGWSAADVDAAASFFASVKMWPETGNSN